MLVLIKNVKVVNEGKILERDILIKDKIIEKIEKNISPKSKFDKVLDFEFNNYALPGVIDTHVHFREPGLTDKGDIYHESMAAITGGVTSFIDMPNTTPHAITSNIIEKKFEIASKKSFINYSFMIGATNDNINDLISIDTSRIGGIKIFLASSTGKLMLDNSKTLENIMLRTPTLIVVHSENEDMIKENTNKFNTPEINLTPDYHYKIRDNESCYSSTEKILNLAKRTDANLHLLHITTREEVNLFSNSENLEKKKITAEVCIPHLFFDDRDYKKFGNLIKCNPSIKSKEDRESLWKGLLNNRLDVISTDHAPHDIKDKNKPYMQAPSGVPSIQFSLPLMLTKFKEGKIKLEDVVKKMCHNPSKIFKINKRGFIKEGYYADIVIADIFSPCTLKKENIKYKCKWSPFENKFLYSRISDVFVNGQLVYEKNKIKNISAGMPLVFNR